MPSMSAEKLGQRAFDLGLVDTYQLESVWGELGSRDVELEELTRVLVRRELITNWQLERLVGGKRDGYFYGDYKVLYHVGAGTFARVYRAAHKETGRVVAVKVLRQRYSEDIATTEQFLREAKMVKPLRHPNIVPIFEVDKQRARPFMIMDFVEGQNLRDFVRVRKKLSLDVAMSVIIDVCQGLDYALSKGVTHRDLKLSNVLISATGRAQLVDFGLAGAVGEADKSEFANAPNPRSIDYAGLERATGVRRNDQRSDIYFVGCMLYHMLAGKPPLAETRDRIQRLSLTRFQNVPPLSEFAPDVPNAVIAIINRSMDLRPEKRYQSPGDMLRELSAMLERIKRGEADPEPIADDDSQKPAQLSAPEREGQDRKILLVESRIELQNVLRDKLKRRGYRVLVISDPQRAIHRFESADDQESVADCVVFGATELGERAVDAFNQFGELEETRDIPAILFVGKTQQEFVPLAQLNEHRLLLEMPLKVRLLRKALLKLLKNGK